METHCTNPTIEYCSGTVIKTKKSLRNAVYVDKLCPVFTTDMNPTGLRGPDPVIHALIIDSIDVPNGTYICKNTWPNEARVTVPITYTPGQMAVEEAFYIKIRL